MIARKNISSYNYSCQKYHEYVNSLLYCLSKNVEIILKVVIFCPFVCCMSQKMERVGVKGVKGYIISLRRKLSSKMCVSSSVSALW